MDYRDNRPARHQGGPFCTPIGGPGWTPIYRLEEENVRLRRIVADLTLDREMLQDIVRRKL